MADELVFAPHKQCWFKQCKLMQAEPAGYCPRHGALVEAYGMDRAEGMEFGYACDFCPDRSSEESLPCYFCDQKACAACRNAKRCCDAEEADLDREAAELENEADELRDRAERVRSRMDRLHVAREAVGVKEAAHA